MQPYYFPQRYLARILHFNFKEDNLCDFMSFTLEFFREENNYFFLLTNLFIYLIAFLLNIVKKGKKGGFEGDWVILINHNKQKAN